MGTVNQKSITRKVEKYAKSNEGKKRMQDRIQYYIENDITETDAGDYLITIQSMTRAAWRMIEELQQAASDARLPESVLRHFDSLTYSWPAPISTRNGGKTTYYYVEIYFEDDLSRPSLLIVTGPRHGQRTGDGIKNIVSLFDTGYLASGPVYGRWDGHPEAGVITSLPLRQPKYFMEKAVDKFNRKWGKTYNVTAYVLGDKDQYSLLN